MKKSEEKSKKTAEKFAGKRKESYLCGVVR